MFCQRKEILDRNIWIKYSKAIIFKIHDDFFKDIKESNSFEDRFKLSSFSLKIYNVAGNRRYPSVSAVNTGRKTY